MKKKIKIALMGFGRIAKKHIIGINKNKDFQIVGIAEKDFSKIDHQIKKKYKVYKNIEQLIRFEEPDIVSILTESGNHYKDAKLISNFNCHVIVEKPLALKKDEAKELIKIFKKKNKKLFVVMQNRFNPPILALKNAVEKKLFSKITMGTVRLRWCRDQDYYDQADWRGTWDYDGGVLGNQAVHYIDMLLWMMGEVKSVQALSKRYFIKNETDDLTVAILEFKSGAVGLVEAMNVVRPSNLEGSISILGKKGSVEISGKSLNEIRHWTIKKLPKVNYSPLNDKSKKNDIYGEGHISFYKSVIDTLKYKSKNYISGLQGFKSIEVVNAIYSSFALKKKITLPFKYDYKFVKKKLIYELNKKN
tara:strand:- start:34 stop:1116 length:1083 start_codon:yes stop_codon:yes gene_type:complete